MLKLKISEKNLSEHLQAIALSNRGGSWPKSIQGQRTQFIGSFWVMEMESSSDVRQLWVGVTRLHAMNGNLDSRASYTAGIYAKVTYSLETVYPITMEGNPAWISVHGRGCSNFAQAVGNREGDPTDLSWWKDYIMEGHVHFSATVQLM